MARLDSEFESFALQREGTHLRGWHRPGDGQPLLLLHGLAGDTDEWTALLGSLQRDIPIVAFDLRGHGKSEARPEDVSPQAFVLDCVHVLSELGIERAAALGQSMGGIVATLFAFQFPDRVNRLMLVDAGMAGTDPSEDFSGLRSWLATKSIDTEVAVSCIRSLNASDRWPLWHSLTMPTLVCFAERSFIPPEEMARMRELRPDFEYHIVADSGHDIHLDQPARLGSLINRFLSI